jgi:sec-independent protein translocase protein TatB
MFGIGGQELVLLMIIGLVVLGPERLPRIANQIGGWLGQARRMTRVMKRQLEEELDLNKAPPSIKPPPALRAPSGQPVGADTPVDTPPRDDDDYSDAHDEGDVGTGVGDEIYDDESDLAVTEADRMSVTAVEEETAAKDEPKTEEESTAEATKEKSKTTS